jgi:hypothetical protein
MSKEILKTLLQTVFNDTGKNPSDIALEMGYKKNYISEMLTPKGKVTEKFLNSFKSKYRYILDNPNYENQEKGNLASDYKEKYLTALEEIRELQKKLLDKKDNGGHNTNSLKKAK